MTKSISILIAAALIAVASQSAQAQQEGARPRASVLVAGNSDETVEVSVLLEEARPGEPCSLSFEIRAVDAGSIGAPLQTEHVMLGPNELTAVRFLFSLSLPTASGTHALLLTVTDVTRTGGCRVRSYFRIVGPGGETRSSAEGDVITKVLVHK